MGSERETTLVRLTERALQELGSKHAARELGLQISREAIRLSANSIRATHRGDFDKAEGLLKQAEVRLKDASEGLENWPEIYYSGFLSDARKEYSEARVTLALIQETPIPLPWDIGVEVAPYLNGLGEAIGELRRFILDTLRKNDPRRCEAFMVAMEDIFTVLVAVDFPEGVTGGLRRTTDAMRAILERTRGDLTMALRQHDLEQRLASWERNLSSNED